MALTFDALKSLNPQGETVDVRICDTCTQALLTDLAALFPPMWEGQTCTLQGTSVMGCAFRPADPADCQLHPYLENGTAKKLTDGNQPHA